MEKVRVKDEEVDVKELGEYIKFMRKSVGLSRAELAFFMGVTSGMIARYELGRNPPEDVWLFVERLRIIIKRKIKFDRLDYKVKLMKDVCVVCWENKKVHSKYSDVCDDCVDLVE